MKRVTAILLLVLLLLAGCGQSHVKTVTVNLTSYTVNTEKNTIFDGQNKYRYTVGGQGGAAIHTVYYPDGSSYYWIDRGGYSADEEGWSENYDPERYVSGSVLKTVLEKADAKRNVQVDVGRLMAVLRVWRSVLWGSFSQRWDSICATVCMWKTPSLRTFISSWQELALWPAWFWVS